jgi:hypothetical protein
VVEEMTDDWTMFPLDNPEISCGLRRDLPKKQRTHQYIPLGRDIRPVSGGVTGEVEVFACRRCGKDKAKEPIET